MVVGFLGQAHASEAEDEPKLHSIVVCHVDVKKRSWYDNINPTDLVV